MSLSQVGQRCLSEREPELGLGVVVRVDAAERRIAVDFPASGESRLYALGTGVLHRFQLAAGEELALGDGTRLRIDKVEDDDGLFTYVCGGRRVREDEVSAVTSVAMPQERLLAGQAEPGAVFDLRLRTLREQARLRQSEVRGFLGGRLELLPHQFHILNEVSSRQVPRVLLADEVGLGKTIEACLILQRLLSVGHVSRVLILVPESLVHQWFVELLRRFNLWFTIFDEARCVAVEESDPGRNPFGSAQLALADIDLLALQEGRRAQVLEGGWDMVVVDEAHHLEWSPEKASPAYTLVEALAARARGLLLLTATPTQLGLEGHFARLRLLDPHRFDDLARFREESERYGSVAAVAEKVVEGKPLTEEDASRLAGIFTRDPEGLRRHLSALSQGKAGARTELLRTLLDQHGTGRVVFRNTRAAMSGFPPRRYQPVELDSGNNITLLARIAREMLAEERPGEEAQPRYAFKEDPRVAWLAEFLGKLGKEKVLLICRSQRKVLALAAALQERTGTGVALFHEGLPLVQRDRNAAWFAEADGAQLLLCSEIGSEGRNFQFAHHLVLFDLPLNPGLLEQRIGRLDRIGQRHPIQIHVPYIKGSATECVAAWYHRGLDAFETSLQGGSECHERFGARLLEVATSHGEGEDAGLAALIEETADFAAALRERLRRGRDRLLELNSFDASAAKAVIARIREADTDLRVRNLLLALLDHFGVRIRDHEEGDLFLDPTHAYIEGFPSIPRDGMLATFKRERAIAREDIRFLSADHPLLRDAIDLLVDSHAGTTAFGCVRAPKPNLMLEAVFLLESVADTAWQVDRFLAPTPVRVVVDLRGRDLTDTEGCAADTLAARFEDAPLARFIERPGFNAEILKGLLTQASEAAEARCGILRAEAKARAVSALEPALRRLLDLQRVNPQVRPEEISLAREQLSRIESAIDSARLRLDSLRLILEGPAGLR